MQGPDEITLDLLVERTKRMTSGFSVLTLSVQTGLWQLYHSVPQTESLLFATRGCSIL